MICQNPAYLTLSGLRRWIQVKTDSDFLWSSPTSRKGERETSKFSRLVVCPALHPIITNKLPIEYALPLAPSLLMKSRLQQRPTILLVILWLLKVLEWLITLVSPTKQSLFFSVWPWCPCSLQWISSFLLFYLALTQAQSATTLLSGGLITCRHVCSWYFWGWRNVQSISERSWWLQRDNVQSPGWSIGDSHSGFFVANCFCLR